MSSRLGRYEQEQQPQSETLSTAEVVSLSRETPQVHSDQEVVGFTESIPFLLEQISQLQQTKSPVIVAITGGSASGKTTLAEHLLRELGSNALIISQDNYYKGARFIANANATRTSEEPLTWDDPEAVALDELGNDLALLANGVSIEMPQYSFQTGERTGTQTVQPQPVIIVEGLFTLNEAVFDHVDIPVFVNTGRHSRLLRRLFRDPPRTGMTPLEILRYIFSTVEPKHQQHIQHQLDKAKVVVVSEYEAAKESLRLEAWSTQTKNRLLQPLAQIEAVLQKNPRINRIVSNLSQEDEYYTPNDPEFIRRGETLRLRKENGNSVLTYKGPLHQFPDAKNQARPFVEFVLDEDGETEKHFQQAYGNSAVQVSKRRSLYQLGSLVFSLDQVWTKDQQTGHKKEIGTFLEARIQSSEDEELLEEVLATLAHTSKKTENYCQMALSVLNPSTR